MEWTPEIIEHCPSNTDLLWVRAPQDMTPFAVTKLYGFVLVDGRIRRLVGALSYAVRKTPVKEGDAIVILLEPA